MAIEHGMFLIPSELLESVLADIWILRFGMLQVHILKDISPNNHITLRPSLQILVLNG